MTGNGTPYFGKRVIADLKVEKESAKIGQNAVLGFPEKFSFLLAHFMN
jgi:hypothetical protein